MQGKATGTYACFSWCGVSLWRYTTKMTQVIVQMSGADIPADSFRGKTKGLLASLKSVLQNRGGQSRTLRNGIHGSSS